MVLQVAFGNEHITFDSSPITHTISRYLFTLPRRRRREDATQNPPAKHNTHEDQHKTFDTGD